MCGARARPSLEHGRHGNNRAGIGRISPPTLTRWNRPPGGQCDASTPSPRNPHPWGVGGVPGRPRRRGGGRGSTWGRPQWTPPNRFENESGPPPFGNGPHAIIEPPRLTLTASSTSRAARRPWRSPHRPVGASASACASTSNDPGGSCSPWPSGDRRCAPAHADPV